MQTKPKRSKVSPANALHSTIGAIANMQASVKALRKELTDCWQDVEDLRLVLTALDKKLKGITHATPSQT